MKLMLTQLKEGENAFRFSTEEGPELRELVGRLHRRALDLIGGMTVSIHLTKLEPDYFLRGELSFEAKQTCGRCAEEFALPVKHPFELGMVHLKAHGRGSASHPTLSSESEELDIQYFEGNELDLAPILEEQALLSLPYVSVCRPDCKGICQKCGLNLNSGECRCEKSNPVSAFAQLAHYKYEQAKRS